MTSTCICCGNKIGFFGGYKLSDEYDNPICDDCHNKFGVKLNRFQVSDNVYDLTIREDELFETLNRCSFIEDGKEYIISYIKNKKFEIQKNLSETGKQQNEDFNLRQEEALKKLKIKKNIDLHILTTGYNFENYNIISYLGVLSGSAVLGTGVFSEFGASISDLFGTQSDMFSDKLEQAREIALSNLKEKSVKAGGNALIGIDFDYITFSNNMIGVVANGTSVIIEEKE